MLLKDLIVDQIKNTHKITLNFLLYDLFNQLQILFIEDRYITRKTLVIQIIILYNFNNNSISNVEISTFHSIFKLNYIDFSIQSIE